MYVNGNPLAFVDPSGLAMGAVNGFGGGPCTASGETVPLPGGYSFNPCDPVLSGVSDGTLGVMQAFGFTGTAGEVAPVIGAAFTIFCSIDSNKAACGPSGWTSVLFSGQNQWVGQTINDTIAVAGATATVIAASQAVAAGTTMCAAGLVSNPACDAVLAYAIYTGLNDLFSVFWDAFGPARFTGSLLPRPSNLGGLGTSPIGIPNQNLSVGGILGQASGGKVPNPGTARP